MAGRRIGPYKVVRELGYGGMGRVYLAERDDGHYHQQVALKLVKGGMGAGGILRRFRTERQILAHLDHPHIAKLLDGGTAAGGLPYFVMEYIDGLPIDVYCDAHKLPLADRLELFRSVCAAMHYAHQRLVVHRDLKPRNILVTADGTPKLLDFGIAKLLGSETSPQTSVATGPDMRLMALEYASPEQVRGEPITTASDVYSLGVLLYELLTGHRPFSLQSRLPHDITRVICQEEPQKPSEAVDRTEEVPTPDGRGWTTLTPAAVGQARGSPPERLRRQLAGDLDNIVLMALRKEPHRRYGSVEQLAEDLRRHLVGLPVLARAPTLGYRGAKFVMRHRAGVVAAGLLGLTLLGGLLGTARQARLAEAQRDLAVRAANSMIYQLAAGLERMVGPTENRLGLLSQAVNVFDEIEGLSSPGLRRRHADANIILAKTYRILGDPPSALRRAIEAEWRSRALAEGPGGTIQDSALLASALLELGDTHAALGSDREAVAAYEESLSLLEAIAHAPAAPPAYRGNLSTVLLRKGDRRYYEGDLGGAEQLYHRSFQLNQELVNQDHQGTTYHSIYATSLERLADVLYAVGKVDRSCEHYREAPEVRQRLAEITPDDAIFLRGLAIALQNVGRCAEQEGREDEGIALYNESIGLQQRLVDHDPFNTTLGSNLIGGLGTLGNALLSKGDIKGAATRYRRAIEMGSGLRAKGRSNPTIDATVAATAQLLSNALIKDNRLDEASRALDLSLSISQDLIAKDPKNLDHARAFAYALTRMAGAGY